ncbi:MAG: hypothetical protein II401_04930 [Bacteroidales bacterium]|nr:hypothetical protein [Bacteroidales bacterium]
MFYDAEMVSNLVAKIQQIFGFGKKKEIFIKNLNPLGFILPLVSNHLHSGDKTRYEK